MTVGSRISGVCNGVDKGRGCFGSSIEFRGFCIDESRMGFDDF